MSSIPEGATHESEGFHYRKSADGWRVFDHLGHWAESKCTNEWLDANAVALKLTAPTWNGPEDGLPPVGLEVEVLWSSINEQYVTALILAHDEGRAVFRFTSGQRKGEYQAERISTYNAGALSNFRPIRTAEQLAAETHRAKYFPQLEALWAADTQRTDFLEAVYALIVEGQRP